ncbi:MAG: HDIG domain-containing protein [Syntrophales bacterium]|nr:HDIG domain-containing protein [Syntrophales bacterium]
MTIPTKDECHALIRQTSMLPNIVEHSFKVSLVAVFLAEDLAKGGIFLDRRLVEAAALLHDIMKTRSLTTGENHAATGAEFVAALGYRRVADVIAQHVVIMDDLSYGHPTEADVVNYADKRVLHDQIVSLQERRDYIMRRYGTEHVAQERIARNWQRVEATEQKLFRFLTFAPDDLHSRLANREEDTERLGKT